MTYLQKLKSPSGINELNKDVEVPFDRFQALQKQMLGPGGLFDTWPHHYFTYCHE